MKIIITEQQLRNLLKNKNRKLQLEELALLLEEPLEIGDGLKKKLDAIRNRYAEEILDHLENVDIPEKKEGEKGIEIKKIDYTEKDNNTLTLYYKTERGVNSRNQSVVSVLKLLGYDLNSLEQYERDDIIDNFKKGDLTNFKLVKGNDIKWAYLCENYEEGDMNSCMSGSKQQKYLDIFTQNSNKVQCLVLMNPETNKILGRALIWEIDFGTYYMDRIYVTHNKYKYLFYQYAYEKGYKLKIDSYSTVTIDNYMFDYYPSMDTFEYLDREDGVLMIRYDGAKNTIPLVNDRGNIHPFYIRVNIGNYVGEYVEENNAVYLNYTTPYEHVVGYAAEEDTRITINGKRYLEYDVIRTYNNKYVYKYSRSIYVKLTHGKYGSTIDYLAEYALYDDAVRLYKEKYGDKAFALPDECLIIYEKKYGEYEHGLKTDLVQLNEKRYGKNQYAFKEDCINKNEDETSWYLIDDK